MATKEEIREGLMEAIKQAYIDGYNIRANGQIWEQKDGSVDMPMQGVLLKTLLLESKLHSQGVVIKVDRECPSINRKASIAELNIYFEGQESMLRAGYVAVEGLIKEN